MATDEEYTDEQIADGLSETAKTVNRLMLTLLALGLFSLLAIGQPDAYLLNPAATVELPSVGAASAKALLIVGPLLLIGVRIYLQIYVQHWREFDTIANARKIKGAAVVSPMRHNLLRLMVGAVFYFLVPIALAAFTWKGMAIPKWWGYGLFFSAVFVSIVNFTLNLYRERFDWWVRIYFAGNITVIIFVGFIYHTENTDYLRRTFDLRAANLVTADLKDYDFRDADLRQANLDLADLSSANLQNANLWAATLRSATLTSANLKGATLLVAKLQGANLRSARLQGANLREARLQGANLREAQLQGADLSATNFEGAFGLKAKSVEKACYRPKTGNMSSDRFRGPPLNLPDGITIPPCKKAKDED